MILESTVRSKADIHRHFSGLREQREIPKSEAVKPKSIKVKTK